MIIIVPLIYEWGRGIFHEELIISKKKGAQKSSLGIFGGR
jgi:hypothetical protein